MTYATYIDQLRRQSGDTKQRTHVDWTGDGTTSVFQMPDDTFPVYDDSSTYTVKVATVTKTEVTDYTLDKSTGTLSFVSAPTNGQAVTIDCYAVHLLDADWLLIINNVINAMGDDFWKEFMDTTLAATVNMVSLDLSTAQPNCIAIYGYSYKPSASDDWIPLENITNWRYDRENNVLYNGSRNDFTSAYSLKLRGLKKFVQGATVGSTLDVPDRYLTILEAGSLARYYRWRYKSVIELVSKLSTESSRTPLQELMMLGDRFDRSFEQEKARLKPQKPPRVIPVYREAWGRP